MTEIFEIASNSSKSAGTLMVILGLVIFVFTVGIFGYIGINMNRQFIEMSPDSLKIRIPMYSRTISRSDIVVDQIRVVNMNAPDGPKFSMRTNGIGLPGFAGGWFRLKGGGKVLASVTDRTKVIVIPTRLGYDIMASVKDPDALIRNLKSGRTGAY